MNRRYEKGCIAAIAVLLAALRSVSAQEEPDRPQFRAGCAAVDVTPLVFPVRVNGMVEERQGSGAADVLMSRALVLDDGTSRIAIVVVDSLMLPRELLDDIKEQARQATGIPTERMLISATHTHSAPSAMPCLGSRVDPEYVQFLPGQIVRSIVQANEHLAAAEAGWAVTTDAEHNHCRRWIFRPDRMMADPFGDVNVRAHMHPGHESPNHIGPSGPADTDLTLLSIRTRDGRPLAVLANYAMHYYGSPLVSGDFCGRFGSELLKLIGGGTAAPGFVGIMSQGTSGDSMWPDYSRPAGLNDLDKYTQGVTQAAFEAYQKIEYRTDVSLAMAEATLKLKRRVPNESRLEWAREKVREIGDRLPRGWTEVYAHEQVFLHDDPDAELKLQAIRIGDLGITAIPDEVFGITGLKLKLRSPLTPTMNLELANGAEGYIPPPEQHKLGGYTTWPARTAGLDVEAEPRIVETLVGLLEEVAKKPQRAIVDHEHAYSKAVLAAKPLSYWRLGEIAGDAVADATGRHPARYEDGVARYLPGAEGSGLTGGARGNPSAHFAGGRVAATVADLGDRYSVEGWFWNGLPNNARAVTGYFFSRGSGGDAQASGDHLGIGGTHLEERWLGKLIVFNGNERNEVLAGTRIVPWRTWNHFALMRDGRHVRVYLNGEQEIEGDLHATYGDGGKQIFLGGRNDRLFGLEGKLDEMAMFDRVLTKEEVASHFRTAAVAAPATTSRAPDSPPRSPEESLQGIHVRDGYEVQLVAAEPLVVDPVAIDWGADGKLWVAEMADYPLGMDGKGKPGGRVRFLEDADDDGRYDRSTVFLEEVSFPTGVMAWGKGVLVTAAPEIFYAEDTNGDGKADIRRPLYSGFLEGNQQLRVNGLRWGLDNWVYCASGSHHAGYGADSQILSHVTGEKIAVGSRDFRIRPDKGLIEPQSGPSQFGRNQDDWGNWFGVQNSYPLWHYVLEDQYIRRNPHFAPPDPRRQVVTPANPLIYPAARPEKRFHSFNESGRFTSACSAMIYRDDLLFPQSPPGEPLVEHAFTCEPFSNLVQHNVITREGVSFTFHRDPAEKNVDFFASEDRWCRPVMARTGPDGALWIVDMYRYMIEHPQWLPPEGQEELRPFFREGDDRGRIYRVLPRGQAGRKVPKLEGQSAIELAAALDSASGWQRDTVQRLLVANQDASAVEPLEKLLRQSARPQTRMQALCTLDGLNALTPELIHQALADSNPGVRRQAVRLSEGREVDVSRLAKLVDDSDLSVRLQLACSLGSFHDPVAWRALARLSATAEQDSFIRAAVMSSLAPENVGTVLDSLLGSRGEQPRSAAIVEDIFGQLAMMGNDATIARALERVTGPKADANNAWRQACLATTLDALSRRGWKVDEKLDVQHRQALAETLESARRLTTDSNAPDSVRAAAVRLLLRLPQHEAHDREFLQQLLSPQTPVDLQRAVVSFLSRRADPEVARILLAGWKSRSPAMRSEILSVLASRDAWVDALLTQMEGGDVSPAEIDLPLRQRLLATRDANRQTRLQKLLQTGTTADRAAIISAYHPAVAKAGDPVRGKAVFEKRCSTCHRQGTLGHEVGPNLASLTTKTPESLLSAILDPSAAVEGKYLNFVVVTKEGRTLTGLLATETASSITLLAAEGKTETVLRSDIEELQSTGKSLMPDGLEKELTPEDVRDVIAFVAEGDSRKPESK